MTDEPNIEQFHRNFAAKLFNETWVLLSKASRTPEEDALMIHSAHASRFHWELVGDAQQRAIGEWQIAKVYSALHRSEPAIYHARRCLQIAQENHFTGFYLGSAYEAMARALAINGDPEARDFALQADHIAEEISDPEEKGILLADLSTIEMP